MLLQFIIENFLSFKDEATLNLIASADKTHPHHIATIGKKESTDVLKVAGIYGANAAGKSNLVKAIAFSRDLILNGTHPDESIGVKRFKLSDQSLNSPSRFQYIIYRDKSVCDYGFSADAERVHEEWLFVKDHTRFKKMFERKTDKKGRSTYRFGPSLVRKSSKKKFQRYEFVMEGTRQNQLFLTEARERNIKEVEPVMEWFSQVLRIISPDSELHDLAFRVRENAEFKDFLVELLQASDIDVQSVEIRERPFNCRSEEFPVNMPKDIRERISKDLVKDLEKIKSDKAGLIISLPGSILTILKRSDGTIARLEFYLTRKSWGNEAVDFEIEEESDGTQRLIHLSGVLFDLLINDKVFIIDELERKLLPLLLKSFIEKYLNAARERACSQLVFATHETHLLDLDLLRRDEIWLIEKDREHSSRIYSLAEFKVRRDINLRKGYLNGRFGAIPFIGDLNRLGWVREGDACDNVEEETSA